jgi:adenylate kinase family enzyme
VLRLADLGPRICIFGPSNSGKSTLAEAIGKARDLEVIHLDRLHHKPNTDWEVRPEKEFAALHDQAILGERWVMDGNYSRLVPRRLARATGAIRLEASTATSLLRYFRRTLFEKDRIGALDGSKDSVKWMMIHHIAVTTRRNRARSVKMFEEIGLPKIRLTSASEIARFYREENLSRALAYRELTPRPVDLTRSR